MQLARVATPLWLEAWGIQLGTVHDRTPLILTEKGAWEFFKGRLHRTSVLHQGLEEITDFRAVRLRDFDHDGRSELLISDAQHNVIYQWSEAASCWKKLDYALPEGMALLDQQGADNGLRFADLNGDGFDDVMQSNESGVMIYLWAKSVSADLGWKRGWTQGAMHHARQPDDPPSFVNGGARFLNRELIVRKADPAALAGGLWRKSFRELIAFPMPAPRSPEASLAAMQVRPGFRVELVACEPLVVDPIAFDWDAAGRLWVIEMRDYPLGLDGQGAPGGVVKILEDSDHDGHYDKATVFLEGLTNPSGLALWKGGVIIAASPDIFYAEDTTGDGLADVRKVLFTGFTLGNQQHRTNGFDWGLDGWLYGANGDSGGEIHSLLNLPSAAHEPVSISGRDFRFRPDTGEFETVSGGTQYGRHRDDWGEWFGNNNPTWLWHVTTSEHYLRRNPKLAVKSVIQMLANYDDATRVFPISMALERFNQPDSLGHVTSANSAMPYRDDLFGPEFSTSVFISEPVHNVVHREVLTPDGTTFTSHRAGDEQASEFLASKDTWFRPTMLKTGPDGALYIADMYRAVLEHPEWIAPETQARLDLRAGSDKGRIYRVVPTNAQSRTIPNLASLKNEQLAAALDSPSGWQRDTVQRLLHERADKSIVPVVESISANSPHPQVRAQALATLDTLEALTPPPLFTALRDPDAHVRAAAVRLSERFAKTAGEMLPVLVDLESDSEIIVRHQLALTLGEWPGVLAAEALTRLASRDGTDDAMRTAILSSVLPASPLMEALRDDASPKAVADLPKLSGTPSPDRAKVIATYTKVADLPGDSAHGQLIFQQNCAVCHRLKSEGNAVGPELAMVAAKPLDWLLTAIFDPSAAVEARYTGYIVETTANETIAGLIVAETANNLVIRAPGGIERAVLRSDVKSSNSLGRSLMPEGLEAALKVQDLADLLAWLRAK